jgi:TatD DNase family protein
MQDAEGARVRRLAVASGIWHAILHPAFCLRHSMIDSHCHLADEAFEDDLEAVVARAQEAGLTHALTILAAGDEAEARRGERLAALWDGVRFATGVHPHQAHECATPGQAAARVREAFGRNLRLRAVGEIGLDYHYDFSPRDVQRAVFAEQLAVARELGRPVIIHTREADADTVEVLRSEGAGLVAGVFHCFTGDTALARQALDLGFLISFAGIVTFPRAQPLRDVAAFVPDDRLLVETDSPFLAPVPYRGKRNEPAWVTRVAGTLAAIRGSNDAAIDRVVTANFLRLSSEG